MPFRTCGYDDESRKSDGEGFLRPKFETNFLYIDSGACGGVAKASEKLVAD